MRPIAYVLLGVVSVLSIASFSSSTPAAPEVSITVPDGGLPVSIGAGPFGVEGGGGSPVDVELTPGSVAGLAEPSCTNASAPPAIALTTTPVDVPTTPLAGRTQIRIVNESATRTVWCCIGTGCTPTTTARWPVYPGYGSQKLQLRDNTVFRCRTDSSTATVSVQEASCAQP